MVIIPGLLSADEVASFRAALHRAQWIDGRATAGHLSARAKSNRQLAEDDPLAIALGRRILDALERSTMFAAAALPRKIVPPLFNCYAGGEFYGDHIDGAIRPLPGSGDRIRTDLSATLFLSSPEEYDGGELVIQTSAASIQRIKLPAGHLVLYPSTFVHRVEPVRRGARFASFFWIESVVRSHEERALLWDLQVAIGRLPEEHHAPFIAIQRALMRRWAVV
jgi:PKHD-type hydroxylase